MNIIWLTETALLLNILVTLVTASSPGCKRKENKGGQGNGDGGGHNGGSGHVHGPHCRRGPKFEPEREATNSTEAPPHKYKYMTIVNIRKNCGGTILSPRIVLTAAQCLDETTRGFIHVTAGVHNRKEIESDKVQQRDSFETKSHPDFNSATQENDVALISVNPPFQFNEWVGKVDLMDINITVPEDDNGSFDSNVTIMGWGHSIHNLSVETEKLMESNVSLVDCSTMLSFYDSLTDSFVCTFSPVVGPDESATGGCAGDEGGPAIYNGKQIGIVVFKQPKVQLNCTGPWAHTNIYKFHGWIMKTMQEMEKANFPSSSGGNGSGRTTVTLSCTVSAVAILSILVANINMIGGDVM